MAATGMPWIRLDVDFEGHPKADALCEVLQDPNASMYLVRLWCWAGKYYPAGRITTAPRLVERAVKWAGAAGELVNQLVELRILDRDGDDLTVHGWDDRNGSQHRKLDADRTRQAALREQERASKAEKKATRKPAKAQQQQALPSVEGPSRDAPASVEGPSRATVRTVRTYDTNETHSSPTPSLDPAPVPSAASSVCVNSESASESAEGTSIAAVSQSLASGNAALAGNPETSVTPAVTRERSPAPVRLVGIDGGRSEKGRSPDDLSADVDRVWSVYAELRGGPKAIQTPERLKLIEGWLGSEKFTADELVKVSEGKAGNPFWKDREESFEKTFGTVEAIETGLKCRHQKDWRDPRAKAKLVAPKVQAPVAEPVESELVDPEVVRGLVAATKARFASGPGVPEATPRRSRTGAGDLSKMDAGALEKRRALLRAQAEQATGNHDAGG